MSTSHATSEEMARMQRITRRQLKHLELLRAARQLVLQWRREQSGIYRIPAGAVLALCEAIDESHDELKGVEK